jgi:alpha-1,2-mannosyltransferase
VPFRSAALIRIADVPAVARVRTRLPLLTAIAAWLVVLGAICYMVVRYVVTRVAPPMVDLHVYRDGALAVLNGSPLYSMHSLDQLVFTYPPAAALLAVPLTLVSAQTAAEVWLAMIYIPLAIVIWFAFRPLLARAGPYAAAVFAVVLGCCAFLTPLREEVRLGQIDIFLVALCLVDCAVARPRWPRGVLIGLATAIKLVPGVFIVYLLITGRRKAAGVAAGTFALVSAITWLLIPSDSRLYWTSIIFNSRRLGPNGQAANQSLRGMIMRLFAPHQPPSALWVAIAVVVAVLGFAAARAVHQRGNELGGIAITGLLAALLSPVAWIHHLCWVVIALGVVVGNGRDWRRVLGALGVGGLFASIAPVWGKRLWAAQAAPAPVSRFLEATFGLAALGLIVVIFRLRGGDPALPAPPHAGPESSAPAEHKILAGSRE